MNYAPPFVFTSKIVNLIADISEKIGIFTAVSENPLHVELRRKNRIQTIHSSLAIENNSLSIEQITAIIEGKRVWGAPNEIQEVKNAVQAYELLLDLDPYNEHDLLRAHRLMMADLVDGNGKYRTDGVGIFNGEGLVHIAPPADRVPFLMSDLFAWLKESDVHPLIKSCVFHYEFEFIHPFQDGNGRMGRLWQTVILKEWKGVFAWLPVETMIKENQSDYYETLKVSDKNADSTAFIEFMLDIILKEIEKNIAKQDKVTVKVPANVTLKVPAKVTVNQEKIIQAIKDNPYVTQSEIAELVGISIKSIKENMKKLQDLDILHRVGADKNGYWEIVKER